MFGTILLTGRPSANSPRCSPGLAIQPVMGYYPSGGLGVVVVILLVLVLMRVL
jgi:hypothetical protein